jgi:hypothetical protein
MIGWLTLGAFSVFVLQILRDHWYGRATYYFDYYELDDCDLPIHIYPDLPKNRQQPLRFRVKGVSFTIASWHNCAPGAIGLKLDAAEFVALRMLVGDRLFQHKGWILPFREREAAMIRGW